MSGQASVVIAGAGIAGIAAAIRLAQAGVPVALLETRRKLGGRATSHTDPATGEEIDNCQHVALRCCDQYFALCTTLGVAGLLTWTREQYWLEGGGRESILSPGLLPAPLHFSGSFLGASFLRLADKLAIGDAMRRIYFCDRSRYSGLTFGELLRRWRQPSSAVSRFWNPVIVSACNLAPDAVCASTALHVFQEGFLRSATAADIGLASVPLARLYDRAEAIISASGGSVHCGVSVERADARSVTTDDGPWAANAVIVALPFERAVKVIPEHDPRLPILRSIRHSPILGVHLQFDRPVLRRPHAVLVERPTQWLFRKDDAGTRLHAVISAADDWMDLDESAILDRVRADITACLPDSAGARILHGRAIKERRATFAATPAFEAKRVPGTLNDEDSVILAGDYTATGWPATMEGATRSGFSAAAAALERLSG